MRKALLLGLLLLSGCGSSSPEATLRVPTSPDNNGVGRVIAGDNAPLPLPPGDWQEVYHTTSASFERFGYLLVDGDKAPIFVHLRRNTEAKDNGFPVDPACYPSPKTSPAAIDLNRGMRNSWDCLLVWPATAATEADTAKNPALDAELKALAPFGDLPKYKVGARLIAGYNGNLVSEEFEFFPEQDGVKSDSWTSDQQSSNVKSYVADVVTWTAKFRRNVVAAAKGEL